MKMSRQQLKAIVKECLLEILSEGLGDATPISAMSRRPQISGIAEQRRRNAKQDYDPRLDTPIHGRTATAALRENIKRQAGGNPIMESIFEDTARTTLPSQLAAGDNGGFEGGGAGKPQLQEQFTGEVEDVFGEETASRWANLAFAEGPSKKLA